MKYGDLIQFEPIESVIKLTDADKKNGAEKLVKTYVMSDTMAENLAGVVIPQLQFDKVSDNKGVFIVGNYGTGKSHLMSVISSIAEDRDMLKLVGHEGFKTHADPIAGKFEVLRFEIGASKMALRDSVLKEIEKDLENRGIDYSFPPADKVTNNKIHLVEMMSLFEEKYPNKGYLIVVDELLDFLRTRKEREVMYDLNFLRELGEVTKNTRIRFIAGVQETLFDNPSFHFVAQSVIRVKDRFEQITIRREDVSYVVSQRLLQKNPEQKAWIREHLEKFSPMYHNMGDRLDEYTDLYPIHPAFLETFEKVYIAEKREVLRTITLTMEEMLDKDVPRDEPGLISYDRYWYYLKGNPSNKADPDIREVIDKSEILEGIIKSSYTRPQYKDMALRIIDALSVHRLTTGSIKAPIGITVENIKDDLCIYDPMLPEMEEDFLLTTIKTIINEIINTTSGQFIGHNSENDQYYIDIEKTVDYNAEITKKANVLEDDSLNKYYYEIINQVTDWDAPEYVQNFRIYQYELIWYERNIGRYGYRFLGAPNERSTAQPPRDFYVYFLPPYGSNNHVGEEKPDEVYFRFQGDDDFKNTLKLYAASHEMADISSGNSKNAYLKEGQKYQRDASRWINKNANHCFKVSYRGDNRSILNWIKGRNLRDTTLKEQIDMVASSCLSPWFNEQYPRYPKFLTTITMANINQNFKSGMEYIAGKKTDAGARILDSFDLLDGDSIAPKKSIYGKYFIRKINKLPQGKVINRGDIINRDYEDIEYDEEFRLGPIWITLILSTLVHSGHITLTAGGKTFDATMLEELAEENASNLIEFKHFERPKDIPIPTLKELFQLLGLPPGQIVNANTRKEALGSMLVRVDEYIDRSLKTIGFLNGNINIWGRPPLRTHEVEEYKAGIRGFKDFLDSIKIYNTEAKLKNFKYTEKDIKDQSKVLKQLRDIEKIKELREELQANTTYLSSGEALLKDESWVQELDRAKTRLDEALKDLNRLDNNFVREFNIELGRLKKQYIDIYMEYHKKHRLDLNGDNTKKRIMQSSRLNSLQKLKKLEGILPIRKLQDITDRISGLKTCYSLTRQDMENSFICPHCQLNPSDNGHPVYGILDAIENDIDDLYEEWTQAILSSVEDPMVKDNISYLKPGQREAINELIKTKKLPKTIDGNFNAGVNTLMQGLEKVEVSTEQMRKSIFGDGPASVDDIRARFEDYIKEITRGKDESRVRIIIK